MFTDSTQTFHYDTSGSLASSNVKISLSSETFHWNCVEIEHSLPLSQVIGAQLVNPKVWNKGAGLCGHTRNEFEVAASAISTSSQFWAVFAFDIQKSKRGDIEKPKFRRIVFSSPENGTRPEELVEQIRAALGYFSPSIREKKILLVANPFGGTSKALATFKSIVLPLLRLAGLEANHELITTTHRNHAVEIGKTLDIKKYRAAATISGDGVFHELMNGLLSRADWRESSNIPLGVIGSGTSNALGQNLDLAQQPLAVLALIKGQTQKMDVLSITQDDTVTFTHLMVAWTLIADVDIESEKFRKLGPLRMAIMVLIRLINFRKYKGKLYLLPADTPDIHNYKVKVAENVFLGIVCDRPDFSQGPKGTFIKPDDENYKRWPVVVDSYFQYFIALNMPWIATDYLACPHTLINDGTMDLLYCEKINRSSVLASFLDAERGVSMTLPNIIHKRIRAFVLEPGTFALRKGGNGSESNSSADLLENEDLSELVMDVSGERYPYNKIAVEVIPSVVNIIIPSWYDSARWKRNFYKEFPSYQS